MDWEKTRELIKRAGKLRAPKRDKFLGNEYLDDGEGRGAEELVQNDAPSDEGADDDLRSTESLCVLSEGTVLNGRFRILRLLGRGGMGEVYEVEDLMMGCQKYALKTVRRELMAHGNAFARLQREVLAAREVSDYHVCRVHEWVPLSGAESAEKGILACFTMDLLSGGTLADRLRDKRPLPLDEAGTIAYQLCEALSAAHRRGVIHRDFKPGNVILMQDSTGIRAVVTDFGLAKLLRDSDDAHLLTKPGVLFGTYAYMAPELKAGHPLTTAADVFALGVVLHEMVTGVRPHGTRIHPNVPKPWRRAITACLGEQPSQRPDADTVRRILEGEARTEPYKSLHHGTSFSYRQLLLFVAAAIPLLIVVIWAVQRITTRGPGPPTEKHIAVLPLRTIGGDESDRAFCDGLTETLAAELSQLQGAHPDFFVVPIPDVKKVRDPSDVNKILGVTISVLGSLQRLGNKRRLVLNVVDTVKHRQIASRQIDVLSAQLANLPDRAAEELAQMLELQLEPNAKALLASGAPRTPGAYEYYEQGLGYVRRYGLGNIDQGIRLLHQAIELDPNYAPAYAGLAEAYSSKFELTRDPALINEVKQHSDQAAALDKDVTAVKLSIGQSNFRVRRYAEAVKILQAVLERNPLSFDACYWLGRTYDSMGDTSRAETYFKRAIDMLPGYWMGYSGLGYFYYKHDQPSKAVTNFRTMITLAPDNALGYTNLGGAYLRMGDYKNAIDVLSQVLRLKPDASAYSNLAVAYMELGRYDDAIPMLMKAVALRPKDRRLWRNLGDAYASGSHSRAKASNAYSRAAELAKGELKLTPDDPVALCDLALYQAKLGQKMEAERNIASVMGSLGVTSDVVYEAALVSELLGHRDRALKLLDKALGQGYPSEGLRKDPDFTQLRGDPRYRDLETKSFTRNEENK